MLRAVIGTITTVLAGVRMLMTSNQTRLDVTRTGSSCAVGWPCCSIWRSTLATTGTLHAASTCGASEIARLALWARSTTCGSRPSLRRSITTRATAASQRALESGAPGTVVPFRRYCGWRIVTCCQEESPPRSRNDSAGRIEANRGDTQESSRVSESIKAFASVRLTVNGTLMLKHHGRRR